MHSLRRCLLGTAILAAGLLAAMIGSVVYSLPVDCTTVVVNGIGYQQCSNGWYQPQYLGTTVQYVVVDAPQ